MQKNKEKAIAKAIGRAIAKKRTEKGLTQEDVAEKLNIGNEAVSRIERGTVIPNVVRLVELAEIFECETDELLIESRLRSMDHAKYLYELFERLNEQDKALLLHLMTTLAERLGPDNRLVRSRDIGQEKTDVRKSVSSPKSAIAGTLFSNIAQVVSFIESY